MQDSITVLLIVIAAIIGFLGQKRDTDVPNYKKYIVFGILLAAVLNIIMVHVLSNDADRDSLLKREWEQNLESKIESLSFQLIFPNGFMYKKHLLNYIQDAEVTFFKGNDKFSYKIQTNRDEETKTESPLLVSTYINGEAINVEYKVSWGQPLLPMEGPLYEKHQRCWVTSMERMPIVSANDGEENVNFDPTKDLVCGVEIEFSWNNNDIATVRDLNGVDNVNLLYKLKGKSDEFKCVGTCDSELAVILDTYKGKINISPHMLGSVVEDKDMVSISSSGIGLLDISKIVFFERDGYGADLLFEKLPNIFQKIFIAATVDPQLVRPHSIHKVYPASPVGTTLDDAIRGNTDVFKGDYGDTIPIKVIDQWCGYLDSNICEVSILASEEKN